MPKWKEEGFTKALLVICYVHGYHNNVVQVIDNIIKKRGLQYETLAYVNDLACHYLTFIA